MLIKIGVNINGVSPSDSYYNQPTKDTYGISNPLTITSNEIDSIGNSKFYKLQEFHTIMKNRPSNSWLATRIIRRNYWTSGVEYAFYRRLSKRNNV